MDGGRWAGAVPAHRKHVKEKEMADVKND